MAFVLLFPRFIAPFCYRLLGSRLRARSALAKEEKLGYISCGMQRHAIHVVLRDGCGRYLAGQRDSWVFTEDFSQAKVFDFIRDRIAEQIEVLRRDHGLPLDVVAIDPIERYEICDICGHRAMPYSTFFDGKRYFCRDCQPAAEAELPANPT